MSDATSTPEPGAGPPRPRGPLGYENWRAFLYGVPVDRGYETPLYSDSRVTDEITDRLGPYKALSSSFAHFWGGGASRRLPRLKRFIPAKGQFSRSRRNWPLAQPTRAADSATAANHFSWGPFAGTTSANFSSQLRRRNVVTMS